MNEYFATLNYIWLCGSYSEVYLHDYNGLMTLYMKVIQPEKLPNIIQDMKVDDVLPDVYTYNIWVMSLAEQRVGKNLPRPLGRLSYIFFRKGGLPPASASGRCIRPFY